MKKNLLALTLLSMSLSSVFADDCCCTPEPKKCIDCECYTPQFYDLQCDCGFFLDVEFLYWYARETDLTYSVLFTMKDVSPNDNSNPFSVLAAPTEYNHLDASWDPGVRAGIGWNAGCDGWDYFLNWTYFKNTSRRSDSVTYTGENPRLGEQGLLNPWQNHGAFDTPIYERMSTKWEGVFNQIDLELGRKYWLSRCFNLRPFIGLRGAWTRTTFEVTGGVGPKPREVGNEIIEQNHEDTFKNRNWGVGFLAGFQPHWYFCQNFLIYGSFDGALLWGEFEGKKKTHYQGNGGPQAFAPIQFSLSNESKENFYSMNALLDLGIGLRWEESWCCDRYRTSLDLGWEHHVWFDFAVRHKPIMGFSQPVTLESYFTNTIDVLSNLVYGGLVVRLRFDF